MDFKIILSEAQLSALVNAGEYCADIWDGTEDEDIAEQDALTDALVALQNAEEVV